MSELQNLGCGIYTVLVQDADKILLLNRPDKLGFPGYLGPGGRSIFLKALRKEPFSRQVPLKYLLSGMMRQIAPYRKKS